MLVARIGEGFSMFFHSPDIFLSFPRASVSVLAGARDIIISSLRRRRRRGGFRKSQADKCARRGRA